MFIVNGTEWNIVFVNEFSNLLKRSDGTYTFGVTDNTRKCVFIASGLSEYMTDKVLCHELTHVYSFENNCNFDIETEEIIADFMSLFGRNIIYLLDDLIEIIKKVA